MYKPSILLLLSSLVAVAAVGGDSPGGGQQQQTDPAPRPTETEQQQPAKPAVPPSGFTPSEKVSADSAVSFPVDI
jgi:hypothetical protein